jgi:hypothetical protein
VTDSRERKDMKTRKDGTDRKDGEDGKGRLTSTAIGC